MAKPITIKITGDAKGFSKAMGGVESRLGKLGGIAATAGKAAAVGIAGIGVAAGVAAYKGITAFADFEKGMNEVFTLLPDISETAMSGMEDQVKDFSKSFGVLPDEVIPALYQSLSAGVPPDNVFAFMETAQMAAKGGVTDLTTAVDGITSVVNAYGAEVVSSTEASDLMFTAVRLGKTTFEEMSASLSNVTPIASGLGVGFEEVTGSIAALTAQGVPTAQATTQIRGALSDLAKEGSKSDKVFRELSGGGFQDFIAGGGTMAEAFQMMSDHADATGGSVLDMFGRVEAGQAVMALTANGGENFADVLAQMEDSAGATESAFETMDGGLSSSFEKIKANFSVILLELGEKLAPHIQRAADWITDNSEQISAAFDTAIRIIGVAVDWGVKVLGVLVGWVKANWPTIVATFQTVATAVSAVLVTLWDAFNTYVVPAIELAIEYFGKAVSWVKENWPAISEKFQEVYAVIESVVGFIVEAIGWFTDAFSAGAEGVESDGSSIMDTFTQVWETIQAAVEAIVVIVETSLAVISAVWAVVGDEIMTVVTVFTTMAIETIQALLTILTGIFELIKAVLTGKWGDAWEAVKKIVGGAIDLVVSRVRGLLTLMGSVLSGLTGILSLAFSTAWGAVMAIVNGIPAMMSRAGKNVGDALVNGVKNALGALGSIGSTISSGIIGAFKSAWNTAANFINNLIPDKISIPLAPDINLPDNPVPTFAMGGTSRGGMAIVGERGPERVLLPGGARVIPNHAGGDGTGGVTVNVATNANPYEIGREVAWTLKTAGI